ncbi:rhomboid family intramembrane serine protease [Olivibacter domesticus]|uniref:Membrane associated serine protease, rhomboid family n=1 Tax=Olivibacter domesticus TaxID=407022 RepID=A0A1H7VSM7_OLID1|nr:rhomboid family intramembrane serine protease [Olivibacter domesticus]SEM12226.1 Membrane associated serine protease, rhomboid family [Olivibacter domesticus]
MKKSFLGELYYKAFQSGNKLNFFIAINTLIFLLLGILVLVDFFARTGIAPLLLRQLALPADLGALLYKPWTILTYMFTQQDFFHFLFNMLWLYWIGIIFLDFLNNRQLTFTYIAGGLTGGIIFLILYQFIPAFQAQQAILIGSSGSVYAVVIATATLVPDYTIRMLFFGNVRLKYLAAAFIVLNILGLAGNNIGGNLAHLGGGLFGFLYIIQLRRGNDWSKLFKARNKKLRVIKNEKGPKGKTPFTNQEYIDSILDKISQSGYNSLSKAEKEALFNAGKQDQD